MFYAPSPQIIISIKALSSPGNSQSLSSVYLIWIRQRQGDLFTGFAFLSLVISAFSMGFGIFAMESSRYPGKWTKIYRVRTSQQTHRYRAQAVTYLGVSKYKDR
jgi:hypothetical protein